MNTDRCKTCNGGTYLASLRSDARYCRKCDGTPKPNLKEPKND